VKAILGPLKWRQVSSSFQSIRQASSICSRAVAKVNDTPEPEPDIKEGVFSMPPNLEEFIPGECLPDIIDVYLKFRVCVPLGLPTSPRDSPTKFVRQYPRRTVTDKGMFNTPS
jgi:hypothetical protein